MSSELRGVPDPGLWVVIPAFNEARVLGDVIASLRAYLPRVVVVDDGSADRTGACAHAAGACVVTHRVNLGQGAALETGIAYALSRGARTVCTFDADGQHPADAIEVLACKQRETGSDIVFGSRFLEAAPSLPRTRRLVLQLALWFTKRQTGLAVTDTHNGLRLMRADAARYMHFEHAGMAHASEILALTKKHGLRYAEAPTSIAYTEYSLRKGQSTFDAVKILFELFYAAWTR
ncbi:MAG TPA: glycosyltransferase family 2 protein [Candidatus Acidoferrales bacterium]|nr:glycosyltransferase family 2 protein [Candidatus Acidoferrales bacterium]